MATDVRKVKCFLLGDGAVGKTSLILTYSQNKYPDGEYIPYVTEPLSVHTTVDDTPIELEIWEGPGPEDYDKVRHLSYPGTDVFVLCFSVVNPTSFESIRVKWITEVIYNLPGTPVILVGTKLDLRDDQDTLCLLTEQGKKPVPHEEAKEFQKFLKASRKYIECSSLRQENVKEVFEETIRSALYPKGKRKKSKNCPLL